MCDNESLIIRCILPGTPQAHNAFLYGEVKKVPLLNCDELFIYWFRNHRVVNTVYIGGKIFSTELQN